MKKIIIYASILCALFAARAFAEPFADLPKGHWAYDAVSSLAASGIVSGDDAEKFSGGRQASRYEAASVVARALQRADSVHASKHDLELLKKLSAELRQELSVIEAKTGETSERLDGLKGMNGWELSGTFIFDAAHSKEGGWSNSGEPNEFRKEQMYLYLGKRIDKNSSFFAELRSGADGAGAENTHGGRGDINDPFVVAQFYVDTKLPRDVDLRVGRFGVDYEEEYGLFSDNDVIFGHFRLDGFQFQKQFDKLRSTLVLGRNRRTDDDMADQRDLDDFRMHYILDLKYDVSERLFLGATGYWIMGNDAPDGFEEMNGRTAASTGFSDWDVKTYAGYFGWEFMKDAKLLGLFYQQQLGKTVAGAARDNPRSWKVALDLKQELLGVGSLWLEYNRHDNNFWNTYYDRYAMAGSAHCSIGDNIPIGLENEASLAGIDLDTTSNLFFARFEREWNRKITTGIRYARGDYGTVGLANSYELGAYITYKHSPNMKFELYYDYFDYGESSEAWKEAGAKTGTDNVVMLRTIVEF